MIIFDAFDSIQIINLRHRKDRRRAMEQELRNAGLNGDPRVHFFDAIRPSNPGSFTSIGAHGVYLSHQEILRQAAKQRQSVLILEDDCSFTRDIRERRFNAGWDIFYGGYLVTSAGPVENANIEGAHMMGFSADTVRRISHYLERLHFVGVHPPIDAAYVWFRRAHPNVVTLFAEPPLANQRPSRSDIAALKWYDRLPVLKNVSGMMRSLISKHRIPWFSIK